MTDLAVRGSAFVLLAEMKRRVLFSVIGIVLCLLFVMIGAYGYTEYLWYRAVGYFDVVLTVYLTKLWLGLIPFAVVTALVGGNMWLARRLAPADRILSSNERSVDRWRRRLDPLARPLVILIALICGLVLGATCYLRWEMYLLWANGVEWGRKDPQFDLDLGY